MAILKDILFGVSLKAVHGNRDIEVSGISFDSRKVAEGHLFVAVKGLTTDGHDYIPQAVSAGAVAVLCEQLPTDLVEGVTYVEAENTARALGICAANFYDRPSEKLSLVGITGTNGKTTVATLSFNLFRALGYNVGLLSTVENRINDTVITSTHTTGDALQINALLAQMVKEGCTHAFMEVSSHALVQERTAGLHFAGGVFTNITHDHLDYHKTFEEYIKAKKLLFDGLPQKSFALVNQDDKRGAIMLQNTKADKFRFAVKSMADFKGRVLHSSLQGMELDINGTTVWFRLVGAFNAYNLLAVYGVAVLLQEEPMHVLEVLSSMEGARGRFEQVANDKGLTAIVDYAHTPDALENVLKTITDLRTRNEQLITVVGCGGNRDKAKRPEMAKIAAQYSTKVILTSDNPRDEEPAQILREMQAGVPKSLERNTMVVEDRREAIRVACNLLQTNDILLVAGKGHETYQEIKGVRHPFDDKEIIAEMLN